MVCWHYHLLMDEADAPKSHRPNGIFTRVNPGGAPAGISEQIRLLIRDGQLRPGDRLPAERELGEHFGVSRLTVREAMRGLEAKGMVTTKVGAQGGVVVTAPTTARVGERIVDLLSLSGLTDREITEARQIFEIGIIPLVCERATEGDIDDLLAICDRGDKALDTGSYPLELSAEFHTRVAWASHNAAIVMLAESFHGPTLRSMIHVQDGHPEMAVVGNREHRLFVAAVKESNVEKASAIMRAHLDRTARKTSTGK
jgi:GntR family transcriptional regulator, transcriptional repressor for pyruvate dehydrogenase complex